MVRLHFSGGNLGAGAISGSHLAHLGLAVRGGTWRHLSVLGDLAPRRPRDTDDGVGSKGWDQHDLNRFDLFVGNLDERLISMKIPRLFEE